jgi:hypothetical protein
MAFIRKVPTKSGATAVQIIYKKYDQIIHIDHIGSAHSPKELDTLVALAKQRLQGNQQSLFPNIAASFTIQLKQSFSSLLWQLLRQQYDLLGFAAYFGEIGHLFGLKTAGCPGKSATPI